MSRQVIKHRMFYLVMYNISDKQKGIQALHATVEYALNYFHDDDFQDWAKHRKTVVLLSGGTSNTQGWNLYEGVQPVGSMEEHLKWLVENGTKCASFNEPDLNNSTAAICFLVPEKSWNRKEFLDATSADGRRIFDPIELEAANVPILGEYEAKMRTFINQFPLA